jgi:RimJ/RimL family protein N-acetyltransferase
MIGIVTNIDDYVRAWVAKRIGIRGFGPSTAIGVQKDGQLIAGAVYHDYRDGQVEASLSADSPKWATRSVLFSLFAYPFIQMDANRLLVTCDESNKKAMKMNRQLGFTPEGILRQMYYPNDAIIWGMLKDECKWLTKKEIQYGKVKSTNSSNT